MDVSTFNTACALGLRDYEGSRLEIAAIYNGHTATEFKENLKQVANSSRGIIGSTELNHILHLVENNPEDMKLIRIILIKAYKQNKGLTYRLSLIGPMVMRMYYFLNQADEALLMFISEELSGLFDQPITVRILMELCLKNALYEECLAVYEMTKNDHTRPTFRRNAGLLTLMACFKLNSDHSFHFAKSLWTELQKESPMRRAGTFAAGLALAQNQPELALSILDSLKHQNSITVRNLKVAALADIKKPNSALRILRDIMYCDSINARIKPLISAEALAKLSDAFKGNSSLNKFERLEEKLVKNECVSMHTLSEIIQNENLLLRKIQPTKITANSATQQK